MNPVPPLIHQFLQPAHHLGRQLVVQSCHEHALLRPRPVVQQRRRNPVPPPVVGYIVTDDVLHDFSSSPNRYGANGPPPRSAAASDSTSLLNRSRKLGRAAPSATGRSNIQRSYSARNRFIAAGARNTPGGSPPEWKSSLPSISRFPSVSTRDRKSTRLNSS